jgi:hypothetical protein
MNKTCPIKSMLYYIFKPATNTTETGFVFPQVSKMRPGYNYGTPNSVHALSRAVEHLPDYEPDLDCFVVDRKAKLTDLLSVSVTYGGFLISPKLKGIFEQFNLPLHKFFPAKVSYKKELFDYFWFHIVCNLTDQVDYSSSKFFTYYNYAHNLGYVDIRSKEDLTKHRENIKKDNPGKTITIWAEKIKMNEQFDKTLDLFEIGMFDANFYISKRLKDMIMELGVTGLSISPADNILI